jgi:PAS domain S-box-containing protein
MVFFLIPNTIVGNGYSHKPKCLFVSEQKSSGYTVNPGVDMNTGFLRRLIFNQNTDTFTQDRYRQVIRLLIFSTLTIFSIESLLMIILELVLNIDEPIVWVIDGVLLVVLLFPLNFIFIVRPMMLQIEEQGRTNVELAKTNEILERFYTIDDVFIAYLDADFNFIRVNTTYARSDGHEPEYYVGKNHFMLFPNEENQRIFEEVVKTGHTYRVTERPFEYAQNPERGVTYWDWTLMPVRDPKNQVSGLMLVLNDVTAGKKAKADLEESWRRFHAVFDQTFQQIVLLTPSGHILVANQTTLDFTGCGPEDINGKPLWELPFWHPSELETQSLQTSVQLAASGRIVRGEKRLFSSQSDFATMDITIKPLLDEDGTTTLLIYEARDITERKESEDALKRSKAEVLRRYEAELHAHNLAETLLNASQALSGSLNSETVFKTLLDELQIVAPYTSAHLELLTDEEHLHVRMTRGDESWPAEKQLYDRQLEINLLPVFHSLLENRQVVAISDTANYKGSVYFPGQALVGSLVALPVTAGEHTIGLVILEHNRTNSFTSEMIQWAKAVVSQAAIAIQNAWLFEQVRDGREHLQALSRRLVEVQEMERHYIARELHDDAGQALASLMVGLRLLERDGADIPAVIARSHELKNIADGILENLHRLAVDLRPASLDHLGLVAALQQHTETISDQHEIAVQFEVIGEVERISGDMETAVYRIVQEALTNIIRHAQASRIDVLLKRRNGSLIVIVEDNGVGFDTKVEINGRLGMVGMQERATMLGGTLTVESVPGSGTTVFLEVPWQSES